MNFLKLFFGLQGRVGRSVYIGGLAVNLFAFLTLLAIVKSAVLATGGGETAIVCETVLIKLITPVLALISLAALHAKRLHDLGRSSLLAIPTFIAFGLCGLIPYLAHAIGAHGFLVFLAIVLSLGITNFILFLYAYEAGERGVNRYGSDPRDEESYADLKAVLIDTLHNSHQVTSERLR